MRKMRQMEFQFPLGHGGVRKGAGRQKGTRDQVCHRARESFSRHSVQHVTCRIAAGLKTARADQFTLQALIGITSTVAGVEVPGHPRTVSSRAVTVVIDAVIAMDGQGPIRGRSRPLGFLVGGIDPIACVRSPSPRYGLRLSLRRSL